MVPFTGSVECWLSAFGLIIDVYLCDRVLMYSCVIWDYTHSTMQPSGCLLVFIEYLTPASTTSRPTHNYYNTDTYEGSYLNVGRNRGPEAPILPSPPSRPSVRPSLPTTAAVENPDYFNTSGLTAAPNAPGASSLATRVPSTTTSPPKQQNNAGTFAAANAYYMDRGESSKDSGPDSKGAELRPLLNGGSSSGSRRVGSREASPKPASTTVIRAPLAGADGETAIWASFITSTVSHYSLPISDPVFHPIGWSFIVQALITSLSSIHFLHE